MQQSQPDPSAEILRRAARDNGFADRITIVRDLSTNWQPDEPADVVVSDIRGVKPMFEHHIPCIVDVRARLLKPGGIQIPGSDRILAALAEAPDTHADFTGPWLSRPYGADLSAVHRHAAGGWGRVHLRPDQLLTAPVPFAVLDYTSVTDPDHSCDVAFSTERAGTVHGITLWFDTELLPGIGYSNAPGQPELVYGQAFFPLEHPIARAEGASAAVRLGARLLQGQYVWSWAVEATDVAGRTHRLRQSSFQAQILPPADLAVRAADYRPPARRAQDIDARILSWFDGTMDLAGLAARLQDSFPDDFPDRKQALDRVADISARYNHP